MRFDPWMLKDGLFIRSGWPLLVCGSAASESVMQMQQSSNGYSKFSHFRSTYFSYHDLWRWF